MAVNIGIYYIVLLDAANLVLHICSLLAKGSHFSGTIVDGWELLTAEDYYSPFQYIQDQDVAQYVIVFW
jgi:hypothetical protein